LKIGKKRKGKKKEIEGILFGLQRERYERYVNLFLCPCSRKND